jgi:hypothetical protein
MSRRIEESYLTLRGTVDRIGVRVVFTLTMPDGTTTTYPIILNVTPGLPLSGILALARAVLQQRREQMATESDRWVAIIDEQIVQVVERGFPQLEGATWS